MQPHEEVLELRRKTLHLLFGVSVASLVWLRWIDGILLLAFSFFLLGTFLFVRESKKEVPGIGSLLKVFEREKHLKTFPGKSAIFFFFGCALATLLFPRNIAVAGIIILAFGDTISNLVGHHFGKILTPLHPIKKIEGPVAAIIVSSAVAGFFVPFWIALLGSTVAMILEFPDLKIFGRHLDDNLIIPIASGVVMLVLEHFF